MGGGKQLVRFLAAEVRLVRLGKIAVDELRRVDVAVTHESSRTLARAFRACFRPRASTYAGPALTPFFDQDLAAEATRTSNRIRGLLTQFHPSLERVLGPRLDHQAVTWLLERYGSPSGTVRGTSFRTLTVDGPRRPGCP